MESYQTRDGRSVSDTMSRWDAKIGTTKNASLEERTTKPGTGEKGHSRTILSNEAPRPFVSRELS